MASVRTITYYFWTLSDWAYLGHRRLVDMASRHGAVIEFRPIDLPAVYAKTGGILLGQRSRQRQDYRFAELHRWKVRLNDPIVIRPKYFPADYGPSSRLLVAAKLAGLPLSGMAYDVLKAVWVDELDISDRGTLREIAARYTADPEALLQAAGGPEAGREYLRYTEEAPDVGVFGSPFYIFDGEPFWGQDRLDFLESALAGDRSVSVA